MENEAGKCVRGWSGRGAELPAHPEWAAVSSGSHAAHGLLCWKALGATGAFVGRSREVGLGCIYIVGLGIKSGFSTVS